MMRVVRRFYNPTHLNYYVQPSSSKVILVETNLYFWRLLSLGNVEGLLEYGEQVQRSLTVSH